MTPRIEFYPIPNHRSKNSARNYFNSNSTFDSGIEMPLKYGHQATSSTHASMSSLGPFEQDPTISRRQHLIPNSVDVGVPIPKNIGSGNFGEENEVEGLKELARKNANAALKKRRKMAKATKEKEAANAEKKSTVTGGKQEKEKEMDEKLKTTVMMRNLPRSYYTKDLLDMLYTYEYLEFVDFVYVPIDFQKKTNFGFAFVNFVHAEDAFIFYTMCSGFTDWGVGGGAENEKPCVTVWCKDQGLEAKIEKYRASLLMHQSVPDKYKPALLKNGEVIPFCLSEIDVTLCNQKASKIQLKESVKPLNSA